jgi:AraC-like DNA-binding protein
MWTVRDSRVREAWRPRSAFSESSFATRDLDEARDVLTHSYADHSIRTAGASRKFDFVHRVASSSQINIGYTTFGTDVSISAPPPQTSYIVCFSTRGHLTMSCASESVVLTSDRVAVVSPTKPFGFEKWSTDSCVVGIRISRDDLEGNLSTLVGRPVVGPVEFEFGRTSIDGRGAGFLRTVDLIASELERPDGMSHDSTLAARLSQLLVTSLLTTQSHEYSTLLHGPAPAIASSAVKRALDYVEADPSSVATVADIARAASVSVRALEHGFQKHVGISPMAYLKAVRLARVHDELTNCDPAETTITSTARRWGFTHLSRFSESYRRKYGVLPSETLRQRRAGAPTFGDPDAGGRGLAPRAGSGPSR